MPAKHSVAIYGGGVGGLSAAHELAERGFAVTVYERKAAFGGKARSLSVAGSGTGGRTDLPGEHGFRFFPGFYKHVTDTMRRIPFGTKRRQLPRQPRAGHADPARAARQARSDLGRAVSRKRWTISGPRSSRCSTISTFRITRSRSSSRGCSALATSCEERYREEYEQITFWDFIGANARSENYRRYLGQGMTRSLVAMRAEESSTRTVGRILLQLFYGILVPGRVFDRLLSGPTNDVWIDPWRAHLTERLGVTLVPNATVRAFNLEGDRMRSVSVERNGRLEEVTADYYVAAMPVEVMQGSSRRSSRAPRRRLRGSASCVRNG